jgi:N12 class adenine-specific DNA methylase
MIICIALIAIVVIVVVVWLFKKLSFATEIHPTKGAYLNELTGSGLHSRVYYQNGVAYAKDVMMDSGGNIVRARGNIYKIPEFFNEKQMEQLFDLTLETNWEGY